MKIYACIPAFDFVSGGNVYNQKILEHLNQFEIEIIHLTDNDGRKNIAYLKRLSHQTVIIDSLLLPEVYQKWPQLFSSNRILGLIHLPHSIHPSHKNAKYRNLEQETYRKCDHLVCTSHFMEEILKNNFGIPENQIAVISPGIEAVNTKSKFNKKAQKMVCISNLIKGKGLPVLLSVCQGLLQYKWSLDIYGDDRIDPVFANQLKDQIKGHRWRDRIHLKGTIDHSELLSRLIQYDLLISVSKFETYGMAVAEAIASKLPFLSTRVGEYQDFESYGMGVYCDVDNTECIINSMKTLLTEEELYGHLSRNAQIVNPEFSTWKENSEKLYKLLLTRPN